MLRNAIYYLIGLLILLMFCLITGCTFHKTEVISINKFLQTDYDYGCLDGDKTFSEIILCQQKQDVAEKTQNHITNDLINKK